MPDIVDITGKPHVEFKVVREAVASLIEIVCPDAIVHSEWVLEFDTLTGLGRITTLLRPTTGADADKIHSWIVGFNSTQLVRGSTGQFEYVGGSRFDYFLNLDVWGFFDYTGLENSWDIAEQEARRITAMIYRNMTLGIENQFIRRAEPPEFAQGDVVPFSDGENVIVMQSQMRILIAENLT